MDCDVIIIGAGVVGLSIAYHVSQKYPNKEIYVLERHEKFGQETSSRNSEVIHAGIYYKPGSLKAELCHEGRDIIYKLADKGVESAKIGKLIVATNDEEMEDIIRIQKNAKNNDINLEMLSKDKVKEIEPHITAQAALYSPESGIVNSHKLMEYFLFHSEDNGVAYAFDCHVTNVEKITDGYKVHIRDDEGESEFTTSVVINSAGLDSDTIARMVGLDYELYYSKGEYFSVINGKHKFASHLVYPVPERLDTGLGIHITLDLQGRMRLGPDLHYIERVQDYDVNVGKKQAFYQSVRRFAPFIELDDIVPDSTGIRPKLQGPNEKPKDFVIKEELPGFINLVGIESPGLTASPAIGKYVAQLL